MFVDEQSKIRKRSKLYLGTYYLNYIIVFIIGSLSLFFITYKPQTGFTYLFIFCCYGIVLVGVHYYDNISRIMLILITLAIGVYIFTLLGKFFFLIIYFVVPILTIYSMIFDKKANNLFKNSFKRNLWKLDLILLLQYIYLIYFGISNIPAMFKDGSTFILLFYAFVLWILANLLALQLLKVNGKILMFITAPTYIIYSLYTLQVNLLGAFVIVLNVLTLLLLLFDKSATTMFKKVDVGSYNFFKIAIFLNVISLILSIFALLYMFSNTLNEAYLLFGIVFIPFYAFLIAKVRVYSLLWKNIFSLLMVILLVGSLALIHVYIMMTLIFIPTSLITIYAFNVDFSTANLFRKNALLYEQHDSNWIKIHFHLN